MKKDQPEYDSVEIVDMEFMQIINILNLNWDDKNVTP